MKTVDFSETNEAFDLKVGRYRKLNDFMNIFSDTFTSDGPLRRG